MSRISVIIPVYNAEAYLDECIQSVLHELGPSDELILVNDGSSDKSPAICDGYASEQITVIHNQNHGVSYTRNCALDHATGDYVTFLDADDYLFPGWRETLARGVATGQDLVFFSEISDTLPDREALIDSILFLPGAPILPIRPGACWYKLFRRDFLSEAGIRFDTELINGEDGIFCLSALLHTERYTVVKAPHFYYYRPNAASATHRYNEKYNRSNLRYIETVDALLARYTDRPADIRQAQVDFIQVRGLYILAGRISTIEDKFARHARYSLFEQPVYLDLYARYCPTSASARMVRDTFRLLKKKKYDAAMRMLRRRRRLYQLAKKVVKRS